MCSFGWKFIIQSRWVKIIEYLQWKQPHYKQWAETIRKIDLSFWSIIVRIHTLIRTAGHGVKMINSTSVSLENKIPKNINIFIIAVSILVLLQTKYLACSLHTVYKLGKQMKQNCKKKLAFHSTLGKCR